MTDIETKLILARIEANWTPFKNSEAAVTLWADRFKSDPYPLVLEAVNILIDTDTGGFRPTIGQVKAAMHDIVYGEQLSETEAWQRVKAVLHEAQEGPETLTGARSAWNKLPDEIKKLVSPRQLLEWNWIDVEKMDTVIQSNFMRSYREVMDRKYRKETISKDSAAKISAIREKLGLYQDPEVKPELPQPKRLAYEKPDWMILREEADCKKQPKPKQEIQKIVNDDDQEDEIDWLYMDPEWPDEA